MSLRETEKRLTAIYSKARADIGREWYKYMQEIEGKTSALYDRLREARRQGNKDLAAELTKEYQDAVKSSTILNARYRAMVQDTTAQLKSVTDIAYAYINGTLPETYAGAYNKLGDVTAGINGYTFSLVDADTVRNLAMNDKTLLPYKVVNGEKFERWNTKIINSQLMQGILQGESIPTMAKRLENATEMTRKAAIRNARTMTTSAENKGRNDSYKRADDDGIIMVKGWICAIDGRTRYEHIHADGQEVGVNEAFSVGGEKLDYPGDPKGSPQNIYNCRCTMKTRIIGFRRADGSISYVKDGDYSGVRAVKGKDGKTVFVDKEKAEELKQEYLPKPLISEGGSGIIEEKNLSKSVTIPDDCMFLLQFAKNFDDFDISEGAIRAVNNAIEKQLRVRKDFKFDEIKVADFKANDKSIFITNYQSLGTMAKTQLYLNKNVFVGRSVEEINGICEANYNSGWWKSKSLEDLVNHEILHARLNYYNSYEKVDALYDELLDDKRVKGFCRLVDNDPTEFLNEVFVALNNGEYISQEHIDVYKEYAKVYLGG